MRPVALRSRTARPTRAPAPTVVLRSACAAMDAAAMAWKEFVSHVAAKSKHKTKHKTGETHLHGLHRQRNTKYHTSDKVE